MTHLNKLLSDANWPAPEIALDIASDEIERLLAGGCARDQGTTQYCAEAARLAVENERLRAAMEQINVGEGWAALIARAAITAAPQAWPGMHQKNIKGSLYYDGDQSIVLPIIHTEPRNDT